jgi:hypothetical protein
MESEGSLPYPQEPAIGLCQEPVDSGPQPNIISLRSILLLTSNLRLFLTNGLLSSGLSAKTLYTCLSRLMRTKCPVQHFLVQSYWACFGLYPSSCMWKTKNICTPLYYILYIIVLYILF